MTNFCRSGVQPKTKQGLEADPDWQTHAIRSVEETAQEAADHCCEDSQQDQHVEAGCHELRDVLIA